MFKLTAAALLFIAPVLLRADDDNDPHPCTFTGHATVGAISGTCQTQQALLPGYHARWTLTLFFDSKTIAAAQQLTADKFADIVRTQSTEDGSDIVVLSLWGDLKLTATEAEYIQLIQSTAPIVETRPNFITVSVFNQNPFALQILFEEPDACLDLITRLPSAAWQAIYLQSFIRLSTNRTDGFTSSDGGGGTSAPHAVPAASPVPARPKIE